MLLKFPLFRINNLTMNRGTTGTIVYGLFALLLTGLFYMFWKKEKGKTCCGCDNWTFNQQYDTYKMLLNLPDIKNACTQNPDKVNSIAVCLTDKIAQTAGDYATWKKQLGPMNQGYAPWLLQDCVTALCR